MFYDITLITLVFFIFSNFYLACDIYVEVCLVFKAIAQPCTQLACLSHDGSSKLTRSGFHRKNILFASIFNMSHILYLNIYVTHLNQFARIWNRTKFRYGVSHIYVSLMREWLCIKVSVFTLPLQRG